MDVSVWTIDSRMKLPDHCFGNRKVIGARQGNVAAGTSTWAISNFVFPDPACIWYVQLVAQPSDVGTGNLRIGLAAAVPTTIPEMDAAVELLPDVGSDVFGPNKIRFETPNFVVINIVVRKGMVTGGRKLVIENQCVAAVTRFMCNVVVSELPTKVPGWPGAWPAG